MVTKVRNMVTFASDLKYFALKFGMRVHNHVLQGRISFIF